MTDEYTENTEHPNHKNKNLDSPTISYARVTAIGKNAPVTLPPKTSKLARHIFSKLATRIIIRLTPTNPLRQEDTFLVRTNFRRLLPRPELIKDVRTVPSGITLVAPSQSDAIELLNHS
ncbi:putative effector protein [Erysiphe necator]|uniref:Putative effector protein n=1 Tax=Uncinula necator TaxID=52586 RepID=A0A0B1P614_UNCNE|nr:putative effector protein [Erysiphe necator]